LSDEAGRDFVRYGARWPIADSGDEDRRLSTCARKGDVIRSEKSGRERIAKTGSRILGVERHEPATWMGKLRKYFRRSPRTSWFGGASRNIGQTCSWAFFLQEFNEGIEGSAENLLLLAECWGSLFGARG
jgi:hypothetical protein